MVFSWAVELILPFQYAEHIGVSPTTREKVEKELEAYVSRDHPTARRWTGTIWGQQWDHRDLPQPW